MIDIEECCRTCLQTDRTLVPISSFDEKDNVKFADKLISCAPETMKNDAALPTKICEECVDRLRVAYEFQRTIISIQNQNSDDKVENPVVSSLADLVASTIALDPANMNRNSANLSNGSSSSTNSKSNRSKSQKHENPSKSSNSQQSQPSTKCKTSTTTTTTTTTIKDTGASNVNTNNNNSKKKQSDPP